jgi:hypothetical protein
MPLARGSPDIKSDCYHKIKPAFSKTAQSLLVLSSNGNHGIGANSTSSSSIRLITCQVPGPLIAD